MAIEDKSEMMKKVNTLRALKVQAVLNVLHEIDQGRFKNLRIVKIQDKELEYRMWTHVNDLNLLKGNINPYRAARICAQIGCNINTQRLREFKKDSEAKLSKTNRKFDQLLMVSGSANLFELVQYFLQYIKQAIVIEYHNLKTQKYSELLGLFRLYYKEDSGKYETEYKDDTLQYLVKESLESIDKDTNIFEKEVKIINKSRVKFGYMDNH